MSRVKVVIKLSSLGFISSWSQVDNGLKFPRIKGLIPLSLHVV